MFRNKRSIALVLAALMVGSVLGIIGVANASHTSGPNTVYTGCLLNGELTHVNTGTLPTADCDTVTTGNKHAKQVTWNARGPRGPVGPKGPKGDKGPQGKQGKPGKPGKDGKDADMSRVEDLEEWHDILTDEVVDLSIWHDMHTQQIADLEARVTDLEADLALEQLINDAQQSDIADLQDQLNGLEDWHHALVTTLDDAVGSFLDLEAELQNAVTPPVIEEAINENTQGVEDNANAITGLAQGFSDFLNNGAEALRTTLNDLKNWVNDQIGPILPPIPDIPPFPTFTPFL